MLFSRTLPLVGSGAIITGWWRSRSCTPSHEPVPTLSNHWSSIFQSRLLRCDSRDMFSRPSEFVTDWLDEKQVHTALEDVSQVSDGADAGESMDYERPSSIVTGVSWSMFVAAWLAAVVAPVFVLYALAVGAWDGLLTFMSLWLLGGVVKLPSIPGLLDITYQGLASWFKSFSIRFEDTRVDSHPPATSRTIYCYHPHGLFSIGAGLLAAELRMKGEPVAMVASSHMRWFNPVLKLLLDLVGIELIGASAKDVQAAMRKGDKSLILVIGGYEEAVMTRRGFERLFLKERLGFVKYAIRYGYSLTPVYAFGENDMYHCTSVGEGIRDWLARWKIPVVLFYGDSHFPMLPCRCESALDLVVGSPLMINKVTNPTVPYLRAVHAEYINALAELYYRNNKNPDRPLEVF
jgi:hypothetical protein